MSLKTDIERNFLPYLVKRIEDEIEQQGHRDTGKTIADHDDVVKVISDGYAIQGYYQDYYQYQERGVSADKIRGVKFAPAAIKALTAWASRRGFTNPKGAAYAIRQKQAKEGMPTRGAFRYSRNGRRTDAFKTVLNYNGVRLRLDEAIGDSIVTAVDNLFAQQK